MNVHQLKPVFIVRHIFRLISEKGGCQRETLSLFQAVPAGPSAMFVDSKVLSVIMNKRAFCEAGYKTKKAEFISLRR